MKTLLLITLLTLSSSLYAFDIKPYPRANISIDEWQKYYDSVKNELGSSKQSFPEHNLEVYKDDKTNSQIAFTTEGHKAHPACVTRHLIEKDGSIHMGQIGYFAGKEEPFAQLFRGYAELTEKMRKEMAEKHGWEQ